MEKDLGKPINSLLIDGGAAQNDFLCSFQASISNMKVRRPANIETTAMGAAYLAGLAIGF